MSYHSRASLYLIIAENGILLQFLSHDKCTQCSAKKMSALFFYGVLILCEVFVPNLILRPNEDVRDVLKRRYLLRQVAIELFSTDGRNHLVVFEDVPTREEVYQRLITLTAKYALL